MSFIALSYGFAIGMATYYAVASLSDLVRYLRKQKKKP